MRVEFERAMGRITIQDGGRPGQRHLGIPLGGPADRNAARLANRLVGNADHEPLFEFALATAILVIDAACSIAWTGAACDLSIGGRPVGDGHRVDCEAGARIQLGGFSGGRYGYLAIGGRWRVPEWRGSVSPILLGDSYYPLENRVQKGSGVEIVRAPPPKGLHRYCQFEKSQPVQSIRFTAGPEFDSVRSRLIQPSLKGGLTHCIETKVFEVSVQSDRVGIRLRPTPTAAGQEPLTEYPEMRSSPTVFGTIQVVPRGHLIVNHVDGPTMGGYPRLGVVIPRDLDRLAQSVGEVQFYLVE